MKQPKTICIIPAREQSTRLPGKMLKDLGGKPLIVQTFLQVLRTGLMDEVIVATDSDRIESAVRMAGGTVYKSREPHTCGSDRIAEAAADLKADIIINVQGDEPFISKENLRELIQVFSKDTNETIDLASLMHPLEGGKEIADPNNVKVVTDNDGHALYFSRAPIPYDRDLAASGNAFKHIGVYAFRREALLEFSWTPPSPLEKMEKIECLRYLENGKRIKMIRVESQGIGIDTAEDLKKARVKWESL